MAGMPANLLIRDVRSMSRYRKLGAIFAPALNSSQQPSWRRGGHLRIVQYKLRECLLI